MKVSRWEIEADTQATMAAYEALSGGAGCDCESCQNFEQLGRDAFPEGIHEIFDRLGIDYRKPAEIYHNCRLESGAHSYGGWYHFLGAMATRSLLWGEGSRRMAALSGRARVRCLLAVGDRGDQSLLAAPPGRPVSINFIRWLHSLCSLTTGYVM